jgi:hypothetical protein
MPPPLPPSSPHTRSVHEAGHAVTARALGFRLFLVSIEPQDDGRFGLTMSGRPSVEQLTDACKGMSRPQRLSACRSYAQISIAGTAGELVDQRLRGQRQPPPAPCADANKAADYLRFAITRGRIGEISVPRELLAARAIVEREARAWHELSHALREHGRVEGEDAEEIVDRALTRRRKPV